MVKFQSYGEICLIMTGSTSCYVLERNSQKKSKKKEKPNEQKNDK